MSEEQENVSAGKVRAPRKLFSALWMVGAVVLGCALLGVAAFDEAGQPPEEESAAAGQTITDSPAPVGMPAAQTIALQTGQQWNAILNSNAGTGYVWQLAEELPADSPVSVSLSGVEPDESNCCGFPVPVTLTVTALKPGTAVVHVVYVRPWETDVAPARQEMYKVRVTAAGVGK